MVGNLPLSNRASIGRPKCVLDTPVLLVDLDVLEANIGKIAGECRRHRVAWRPHIKVHKTPEIAKKQIAAGAIGITCAKLGEAEVMACAGVGEILIANQVVGEAKMARLASLTERAVPIVSADCVDNLAELDSAAARSGKRLKVAIEVDTGMKRAGVDGPAAAVALAGEIVRRPHLSFAGLIGWEGHAQAIRDGAAKRGEVAAAIGRLVAAADACRNEGYQVEIVSCGGSGTFPDCIGQPGVSEVQIGGAIFSDMYYRDICGIHFPFALTILCTVTSRPTETRVVLDAGTKAMSADVAAPLPIGLTLAAPIKLSAEHARIDLAYPNPEPRVGERVELVPGYADTTVHLHNELFAMRKGRVESVWRIAARGMHT